MIRADEALQIISDSVRPLSTVTVSLQRARGLVLAEGVRAAHDVPPFDNSAMDGFAIRSEDVQHAPITLALVGEISAGLASDMRLESGQAMAITTGAPIPASCDAVVQQEWTEPTDAARVKVLRSVSAGHNIRSAGADVRAGQIVLPAGQAIRPQEIGVLASIGRQFVTVHRRPTVAILATGNELVELDRPLPPGKIRNSNGPMLRALVEELGVEVQGCGVAADDRSILRSKLSEALRHADMVITLGGVSVGKYDLVMDVLKELGVTIKFWKVNIKPGMPLLFGMHGSTAVMGLPGNPVSSMVTFLKFARPALLRMLGCRALEEAVTTVCATLEHEITKTDGKRHFVRGIIEQRDGVLVVRSTGSQVSNILTSLSKANCLIVLPEEQSAFAAGEMVEVELL
jgi:molybdopterin molybdotransferase